MALDPLSISAIIGGASAIAGAGMSAGIGSTNSHYVARKQIRYDKEKTKLMQEYNDKVYAQKRQDTWDMINYDSAENQRKRFEEAGLNPALMMQGQGAGSATSMTAPEQPDLQLPASNPYQLNPNIRDLGTGIESAARMVTDGIFRSEQRKGIMLDNSQKEVALKYQEQQLAENLLQMKALTKKYGLENDYQEILNKFTPTQQNVLLDMNKMDLKLKTLEEMRSRKEFEFLDTQQSLELSERLAGIRNALLTGNLSAQQARKIGAEAWEQEYKNYFAQKHRDKAEKAYMSYLDEVINNSGPNNEYQLGWRVKRGLEDYGKKTNSVSSQSAHGSQFNRWQWSRVDSLDQLRNKPPRMHHYSKDSIYLHNYGHFRRR